MTRFLLGLLLFVAGLQVLAQDIPVKQEDRSSFSFVVPEYIVIKNFEITSAVEQEQDDQYLVQLKALNAKKEVDTGIRGNIIMEINGKAQPVKFVDGMGQVSVNLKDQEQLVIKDLDSGIIRKGTINKTQRWYGLLMLIPGVIVLWLILSRVLRSRRQRKDGL